MSFVSLSARVRRSIVPQPVVLQPALRGLWMKLMILVVLLLGVGGQTRAQSSCTSLPSFYFNSSNETFYYNYNVVAGDTLSFRQVVAGTYTLTVTPPGSSSATTVNYNGGSYTVPTTGTLQFAFTDGPNPTTASLVEVTCNPPQTTWTVNTTADDATGVAAHCAMGSSTACSLRDALAAAAASTSTGLVVNFSPTAFPASNTAAQNTITLANGVLTIPNNTTIQGLTTGSGASLQNLVTVSGGGVSQVFSLASGVTATIDNLTITLGGGSNGGAIINGGTLTVNQSTLTNNPAYLNGGAIYSSGNLTITGSTLSSNRANVADLGFNGGAIYQSAGTLTISNSTLTGNSASNSLANGGAIYVASGSSASLTGVTVTGNSATNGGGIYVSSGATLNVGNTLMFANSATSSYADLDGTYTGSGYLNTGSSGTSPFTSATLGLAPLGFYGGPTQTMPAYPTSPAFCHSSSVSGTDQRGVSRTTTYSSFTCADVGATNSSYSLAFTTEPASTYSVGVDFTTSPVASFKDDGFVLPFTTTGQPVVFSDQDSAITGVQTYNFSAGVATPTTSAIGTPESSDTLTAEYIEGSLVISSTSTAFAVVTPLTGFSISTLTTPVAAGTAQSVTVTALNGTSTSTSYTGTVSFTSTDSAAVLPASYTFVAGDNGVHTFTNGLTFKTAGSSQTLTVTDATASVTRTSNGVTVTAGAAASVVGTGTTSISAATGAAFSPSTALQVQVLDAYGNPVSGVTVTYSVPSSGASAVLSTATCVTNASGICSVTATANSLPGSFNMTAAVGGATAATFSVTNTGAATYTVTTAGDTTSGTAGNCTENGTTDVSCSLRDALAAAAALPGSSTVPVTIHFGGSAFAAATTITLANGTLAIPNYTTIQGLTTGSGATLTNLVTVSGNSANTVFAVASGLTAAINNLTITQGQVILCGGGINNAGTLTVNQSAITNNKSFTNGAGVCNNGTLTITGSTLSSNAITLPGAGGNGGGIYQSAGELTISSSTLTGNSVPSNGAAIYVGYGSGSVNLTSVTVTGNSGGAIYAPYGGITLSNTIVSGNSGSSSPDIGGSYTDNGSNLVGSSSPVSLAPLGNYGGPTQTMPALPGSPAICAGLVANLGGQTVDQRGYPRPGTYGSNTCVDIGATQTVYSLAFVQQPTNTQGGSSITPAPTVQLEEHGVAFPLSGVSIGISAAAGTLSGTTSGSTSTAGLATFSGLSMSTAETNDTLIASLTLAGGGAPPVTATSSTFNIITVNHFVFTVVPTTATAGNSFNVTVTAYTSTDNSVVATGYTGPVTFTSTDPQAVLPGGTLSLTAGVGSFTVTLKTAAAETITVADASGSPSTTSGSITVSPALSATTAQSTEVLTQNHAPVAFTPVTTTGGRTPLVYSVSPALPAGLSLNPATGAISGTPTAVSTAATYTITATDANGATATSTFSLKVNVAVSATTSVSSEVLTQNHAATAFTPVTATGGTNSLTYSVSPALPAGLSLNTATGAIMGTPTVASATGTYTVTATDANGATATSTFSLTVNPAVSATVAVATTVLTQNHAATAFMPVTATGGTTPLVYSVSPALPAGLSLNTTTGAISGTPTAVSAAGTYTVTATDANGATGTANFSLAVNVAVSATTAVSSVVLAQTHAVAPFTPVTATGGTTPLVYSVSPALPAGLSLNPSTGAISGTPTATSAAGTYVITVTDANGATATANFTLTVNIPIATATVVTSSSLTPVYGASVLLTANVTPASTDTPPGTASFYTGSTLLGTVALNSSGTATLNTVLPLGLNAITVVYSGSALYAGSTSSTLSVSNRTTSSVTFSASPTTQLYNNPIVLTAQVASGTAGTLTGTVSFLDGSTVVATVPVGTNGQASYSATSLADGGHSLTASYSGDPNFLPSTSTVAAVAITVGDIDLSIGNGQNQSVLPGATVVYTFSLSPLVTPTFLYDVHMTATGLPAGATYTFSPAVIPAGSGTTPVTLTIQTAKGIAALNMPGAPGRHNASRGLAALALGLMLPLLASKRARRRLKAGPLAAVVFSFLGMGAMAGMTGCGSGGFYGPTATSGHYTITVTATSADLVRVNTVELTIQ